MTVGRPAVSASLSRIAEFLVAQGEDVRILGDLVVVNGLEQSPAELVAYANDLREIDIVAPFVLQGEGAAP